jgi:DNA-nicking Smr family endonuclease
MTKRPPSGRDVSAGPSKRKSPKGGTSPEDLALWHHTANSVTPLKKAKARVPDVGPPEETMRKSERSPIRVPSSSKTGAPQNTARTPPIPQPQRAPLPKAPPPILAIERRTARRIARGHVEIDARLDLHGLTQANAERRLRTFLLRARADGLRTVLVITGKGAERDTDGGHIASGRSERGVLRRSVPLWLEAGELRDCVAGIAPAHVRHGGSGALYIHLRKMRGG